jgi:hypothetical protein
MIPVPAVLSAGTGKRLREDPYMSSQTLHILSNEWKTLLRGKWVIGYGLIFLILTDSLLRFGGGGPEAC